MRSTGPRTVTVWLATRQNAIKHGFYSRMPPPDAAAYRAFVKAWHRKAARAVAPPKPPPEGPVW